MIRFFRLIPALVLLLGLGIASPGLAEDHGNGDLGDLGGGGPSGEGTASPVIGAGLANATTNKVVRILRNGVAKCKKVQKIYRFDCYRDTYRSAASSLDGKPAYADARMALKSVEAALDKIMITHADPTVRRKRKALKIYRPIKPSAVPQATVDLSRALDRAETLLLRSPDRTGTHYARIAQVVNSSKVLLRSRLYPDGEQVFRTAFA